MKIKDLVNYWDKHARGRLTRGAYFMALSDQHHKRLVKCLCFFVEVACAQTEINAALVALNCNT